MNPVSTSNAVRNQRTFRLLGYALVFLMMACVVITIGSLMRNVLPGWNSIMIEIFLLFIVIDRLYTYRQLKTLTPLSSEWTIAFGAQWLLIALVIRFLLSYAQGLASLRADLSRLTRGDLGELITPEFVVSLLLALLIWYLTGHFLDLLDEIGLDQAMALQENPPAVTSDVVPAHQRLVNLIFGIAIGLAILTALSRVDYRTFVSNVEGFPRVEFSRFSGGEAGALLYFVFGLALLSLSRLMSLQTHWNRLRIPVTSRNLTRQWGIYSLFFVLILAMIVSLLPSGESLGLFSLLGTLLGFLMMVLFFIGQLILSLILLLFSLPFLLFGQASPFTPPAASPPPLPVLPEQPLLPTTGSATWAFIRSLLLWGGLLAIIVFSVVHFVRQHGGMAGAIRRARITNWLILAWQWLYRGAGRTRANLSHILVEGWQNIVARLEGKRMLPRSNLIRPRSLDPRRQVYFYYLAMIRRGEEQGLRREPSQTPSEYAATLEKALPSAEQDIDSITESFIEARYSRQEIDSRKAEIVRAIWGRIRRAFQEQSQARKNSE